jgi:hypothetical protein
MSDDSHSFTADRIDDAGLALLASPYIGKALHNATQHSTNKYLHAIGEAGGRYHAAFDKRPLAEVAGLALVAPGVGRPLAAGIDKTIDAIKEKTAAYHAGVAATCARFGVGYR